MNEHTAREFIDSNFALFDLFPGSCMLSDGHGAALHMNECTRRYIGIGKIDEDGVAYENLGGTLGEDAAQIIYEENIVYESGEPSEYINRYTFRTGESQINFGKKKLIRHNGVKIGVASFSFNMKDSPLLSMIVRLLDLPQRFHKGGSNRYMIVDTLSDVLSNQESTVSFYLLRGYSAKEIAVALNRSHRTIECHVANIKEKFAVRRRSQLIDAMVDLGFLHQLPKGLMDLSS